MLFTKKSTAIKKLCLLAVAYILPLCTFAQQATAVQAAESVTDPYQVLRYVLVVIAGLMALVIGVLSNAVIFTGRLFWEKQKEAAKNAGGSVLTKSIVLVIALIGSQQLFAQAGKPVTAPGAGLPADLYVLFTVVGVEFVIVLFLAYALITFVDRKKKAIVIVDKPAISWFQKINRTVPVEKEYVLDLHHNYDGIRELDNNIPGWWKLAFLGTFLFGLVYMYRLFGSESMPRQMQELVMENEKADRQKLEYLKEAANNIDENNVVMLDSSAIGAGRELFLKNCVACHGDRGQGGVGPNLTDKYWLHEGSVHKIFYSIKYGWQEKGMKSWKEDFSPRQIAEIASFVRSLKNTEVAGGKEKQGDLYLENEEVAAAITKQ